MSNIKLKYPVALDLAVWVRDSRRERARVDRKWVDLDEVMLMEGASPAVVEYLILQLGTESFYATALGWGFLTLAVSNLWESVRVQLRLRLIRERVFALDIKRVGAVRRALWMHVRERDDPMFSTTKIDPQKRKAELAALCVLPLERPTEAGAEVRPGYRAWTLGDPLMAQASRLRASERQVERIDLQKKSKRGRSGACR